MYDVTTQTFTTISRSGTHQTLPAGINNAGQVSGILIYRINLEVGFEMTGSKFVVIQPPGTQMVNAAGISANGTVPGFVVGTTHTFLFSHGKYEFFSIPNAPGAIVSGISSAGLVGFYNPSSGVTAGFVYQNKTLTTVQFPGSSFTQAYGINASGEVVGFFEDAGGNGHGFTWTPPAAVKK